MQLDCLNSAWNKTAECDNNIQRTIPDPCLVLFIGTQMNLTFKKPL